MPTRFSLNVNGATHAVTVDDANMPLLYALRDELGFNNPRFGCGLGQCGACTVHIDGVAVRSCMIPVAAGAKVLASTSSFEASARRRVLETAQFVFDVAAKGGLSPDGQLPEIVERADHPWFIGVQFHPELKSKPLDPHPLFKSFIAAAVQKARLV